MEKKLWELVNPSDPITFRATEVEAVIIADRMLEAMYFVNDAGNGMPVPSMEADELKRAYEAIWKTPEGIASYAAAYDSFLIGTIEQRGLYEKNRSLMTETQQQSYRADYHERRRSSMNDICQACWNVAAKIAATKPDEVNV